jgi:hypothetical protein
VPVDEPDASQVPVVKAKPSANSLSSKAAVVSKKKEVIKVTKSTAKEVTSTKNKSLPPVTKDKNTTNKTTVSKPQTGYYHGT